MRHKIVQALSSLLLVIMLSGCSFIEDPISLIKTPDLPADKASLNGVIQSQLPTGASILRPRSDTDSSQIRIEDLNNDGILEAVVFYQTPDEEIQVHGMILQQQGDTWVKKLNFDGEGTVLESFDFVDLTNDGNYEIVAGFSRGDRELQNGLIVYQFTGDALEKLVPLPYTHFEIGDMNGDGANDLTVVSLQKNELSYIVTYQYNIFDKTFSEIDRLDLGSNVESYYNIVAGEVAEDKEGIILDTLVSSNDSFTKLIIMEDNKFIDVIKDDSMTYKPFPIDSEDINGDGILEIGVPETPVGWESRLYEEIPYFTTYYQWDGELSEEGKKGTLNFVLQRYHDINNRFYLNFPEELYNQITITPESNKESYLNFVKTETGESVAEIQFFNMTQWAEADPGWNVLIRDKNRVIAYRSHGDLKFTKKENKPSNNVAPIERKGN
ncbi:MULTISPECIES: hypothetical protein [Paenibacillus]|uniref:VCBS repeat-containing protein n=1 Tax=Paenibacillus campinasensis TaxID=66347 RepID=A0A268F1Z4_9BACL|nr:MULTISPECIES: hypothetical protein [Paenibacillus]MUG65884.1 hypothetical protein [Paenibacillus campinasensis]PAD79379.1 hypothetical protein CHH67_03995 [Paenibacillus campinasensis]PAK51678.1 hypothetical protein CHH75_14005 [Paenibacillus sp. 7541]